MGRSDPRVADDYAQAVAEAARLRWLGAGLGARTILFNATMAAQRQAAQARDLAKRPALGGRVEAQEHLHAANDHASPSAKPAPVGGGL